MSTPHRRIGSLPLGVIIIAIIGFELYFHDAMLLGQSRVSETGSSLGQAQPASDSPLFPLHLTECTCPTHGGQSALQGQRIMAVSGIRVLDSLPATALVITPLSVALPLTDRAEDSGGYQLFFATMQLKHAAAQHGANAIVTIDIVRDSIGKKVVFTSSAVKLNP